MSQMLSRGCTGGDDVMSQMLSRGCTGGDDVMSQMLSRGCTGGDAVMLQMLSRGCTGRDLSQRQHEHYVVFDAHQARPLLLVQFRCTTDMP